MQALGATLDFELSALQSTNHNPFSDKPTKQNGGVRAIARVDSA